jgi:hypothetical protein
MTLTILVVVACFGLSGTAAAQLSTICVSGVLIDEEANPPRAGGVVVRLHYSGQQGSDTSSTRGVYSLISRDAIDSTVPRVAVVIEDDSKFDDTTRSVSLVDGPTGYRLGKSDDIEVLSRQRPGGSTTAVAERRLKNAAETSYWDVRFERKMPEEAKEDFTRRAAGIWASAGSVNDGRFKDAAARAIDGLPREIKEEAGQMFSAEFLGGLPSTKGFKEQWTAEKQRLEGLESRGRAALERREAIDTALLREMLAVPASSIPQSWAELPGPKEVVKPEIKSFLVKHGGRDEGAVFVWPKNRASVLRPYDMLPLRGGEAIDDRTVEQWLRAPQLRRFAVLRQLQSRARLTDEQREEVRQAADSANPLALDSR